MSQRRDGTWVRLIGVAKLVKVAVLIALGVILLTGVDGSLAERLARWSTYVHVDPNSKHLHGAIARIAGLSDGRKELVACASFAYAGLFATEGIGLLCEARWAEWLTVVATTSFIPMEIYELVRELTVARVLLLLVNLAIVVYLVFKLRSRR
ncbi:MAG TPA: DUF2127 domain-containing protein [Kofleriaceae bacterium]|nr:DUF2127 domain-containing protein [Kofleriaceae bacterium]